MRLDKEQKDTLGLIFLFNFAFLCVLYLSFFLIKRDHVLLVHQKAYFLFKLVLALKPLIDLFQNHLLLATYLFISSGFIIKLYLGKNFFSTADQFFYQYRYLVCTIALLLPGLSYFLYLKTQTALGICFGILACAIFLSYCLFTWYLRLENAKSNHLSIDLHNRILMPKKRVETDYSINLKIHPNSYVNILNPFRGIGIVGGPGSGKSYSIIEPIIDQIIHKNFTSLIYDFKFPTLSEYAYAAYKDAQESKLTNAQFKVIYFKDIRYSNRCNPLDPQLLTEYATANQAATTILLNVNRTWTQKQGEFFSDSAIIILTAIIWYLRCKSIELGKQLCSLAHVIEFASFPDYAKTIEILTEHPEVKNTIVALQSAKQTGAMEQLGGQLGSLQIALSKLNDKKLLYVMSGNDFTLDINKPGNEHVLILGNDNEFKDTYAPALSLYSAISTRLINQKNRKPCALIIDEFPTLYIQNYEQLPATARSNKVACIIAMQDFAQLRDTYGQTKEKTIISTHGNLFIGATPEKATAQFASELIGKDVIEKKSYSIKEKSNINISENIENIIYPHEIQQLNTGQFVGIVTDINSDQHQFSKETKKVFAGSIEVSKPNKYYTDNSQKFFKESIPYVNQFNTTEFKNLDVQEQENFIEKLVTDNINAIHLNITDLIEYEFWIGLLFKYIIQPKNRVLFDFLFPNSTIHNIETKEKYEMLTHYAKIAINEEAEIKSDPERASEINKAINISLKKALNELSVDAYTQTDIS